jgi:hypothetical protein
MTLLRAHSTPHASSSGVGSGGDAIQSLTFFALVTNFQSSKGTSIYIKGAVFDRVRAFLHRFGGLSLSLAALLLPPFPTSAFVIGAGVTRYSFIAFVLSFDVGRACRFALLAYPRQAVRDKHVVGAHAGACSSFWRCADVYRVAGVARLQGIRTGCASRGLQLYLALISR